MKKTSCYKNGRQSIGGGGGGVFCTLTTALIVIAILAAGCRRPADDDGAQTAAESLRVSSLTVQLNDGGNLIENFSSALRNWEIAISADDNKQGNFITIDAVPETGGEDVVFLPVDKTLALPIHEARTLAVCPESMPETAAYTVLIIPAQNDDPADHHSMNLSLHYAGGANLIQDFSASSQTYSINIDQGKPRELFIEARSMSSKSQVKITYDGSILEDYKAGGNADTSISADDLPKTGYKNIVVSVKSQAGTYMDYTIRLNAPEGKLKSYAGTIVYTGSATLDITGLAVRTTSGTDSQAARLSSADPHKWTLDVGESWTPYSFVVEFQNAAHVSYKSAVIIPAIQDAQNIVLTVGNVGIVIASVQDMQSVKNRPTLDYVLGQDLDMEEVANWSDYSPTGFSGKFYGNGYTVDNLVLNKSSGETGFFASLGNNAYLENFTVNVSSAKNLTVNGALWFGGVVGKTGATGINIKGVKVKGSLSIGNVTTDSSYLLFGGFFGEVQSGKVTIENCVSEVGVSIDSTVITSDGTFWGVGGFIGKANNDSIMKNCYSTGSIDIKMTGNKPIFAGGFIGQMRVGSNKLENCFAGGAISVKNNAATITSVYEGATFAAGGLVGYITDGTPVLQNCAALGEKAVAVGNVSNSANYGAGRLVGQDKKNTPASTYLTNYALRGMSIGNTEAGAPDNSDGGNTKAGTAKSIDDFKNPATWSALQFNENIWDFSTIGEKGRPELR